MDRLMYNYMEDSNIRGGQSFMAILSILENQLDFPRNTVTALESNDTKLKLSFRSCVIFS